MKVRAELTSSFLSVCYCNAIAIFDVVDDVCGGGGGDDNDDDGDYDNDDDGDDDGDDDDDDDNACCRLSIACWANEQKVHKKKEVFAQGCEERRRRSKVECLTFLFLSLCIPLELDVSFKDIYSRQHSQATSQVCDETKAKVRPMLRVRQPNEHPDGKMFSLAKNHDGQERQQDREGSGGEATVVEEEDKSGSTKSPSPSSPPLREERWVCNM